MSIKSGKKLTIGNRKMRMTLTKILIRKRNIIRTEDDIYVYF